MSHRIAPSILAANFGNLERDFEMLNKSRADWVHVDIMDGQFVPNISFGFPVMKAMKALSNIPLDVHLMIERPEGYFERFAEAGADVISVHVEGLKHLHDGIAQIKKLGVKASLAINPGTSLSAVEEILPELDMLLIMSVNPGFGGQSFIESTPDKVRKARGLAQIHNPNLLIEVDGGVKLENAHLLLDAGANVLVAGSAVFKASEPSEYIGQLKDININTKTA